MAGANMPPADYATEGQILVVCNMCGQLEWWPAEIALPQLAPICCCPVFAKGCPTCLQGQQEEQGPSGQGGETSPSASA
jgi:hypothetical protein